MSSKASRPITWQIIAVVVAVVAVSTAAMRTHALPSWMPPFWLDVGNTARESLLLVAPLVAAIAAWVAGWNHTIVIGPTPGRPQLQLVSSRVVPLTIAAIVGQWFGLIPVIIASARSATWGGLPWASVVAANLELWGAIGIGFLVGVIIRSRLAPLAVAIGMFVTIFLTALVNNAGIDADRGPSILSVAWTWFESGASIGSVDGVAVNVARMVLFGLVGLAGTATAASWPDVYRNRRGAAALLFLAPLALAAAMLVIQPDLTSPIDAQVCEPVGTTPMGAEATVCVTPDLVASLEPSAAGVRDVITRFGYGATPADVQASGDLSPWGGFIWRSMSRQEADAWLHDDAVRSTASTIAGELSCHDAATDPNDINDGGRLARQYTFVQALIIEILRRTVIAEDDLGLGAYRTEDDFGMGAWSDAALRDFIADHADGLAMCSVTGP